MVLSDADSLSATLALGSLLAPLQFALGRGGKEAFIGTVHALWSRGQVLAADTPSAAPKPRAAFFLSPGEAEAERARLLRASGRTRGWPLARPNPAPPQLLADGVRVSDAAAARELLQAARARRLPLAAAVAGGDGAVWPAAPDGSLSALPVYSTDVLEMGVGSSSDAAVRLKPWFLSRPQLLQVLSWAEEVQARLALPARSRARRLRSSATMAAAALAHALARGAVAAEGGPPPPSGEEEEEDGEDSLTKTYLAEFGAAGFGEEERPPQQPQRMALPFALPPELLRGEPLGPGASAAAALAAGLLAAAGAALEMAAPLGDAADAALMCSRRGRRAIAAGVPVWAARGPELQSATFGEVRATEDEGMRPIFVGHLAGIEGAVADILGRN